MNREETVQLILNSIAMVLPPDAIPSPLDENTRLFSRSTALDSMALVSILTEVEQQLNDRTSTPVIIVSERAMSLQRSPFRSVGSLADYLQELLAGPPESNA